MWANLSVPVSPSTQLHLFPRMICCATRGNTLQSTATHCNPLQHTAIHCNTLESTATHCNPLQHIVSQPLHTIECNPDNAVISVFLRKSHRVNPFNSNFCKPSPERWKSHLRLSAGLVLSYFLPVLIPYIQMYSSPSQIKYQRGPSKLREGQELEISHLSL